MASSAAASTITTASTETAASTEEPTEASTATPASAAESTSERSSNGDNTKYEIRKGLVLILSHSIDKEVNEEDKQNVYETFEKLSYDIEELTDFTRENVADKINAKLRPLLREIAFSCMVLFVMTPGGYKSTNLKNKVSWMMAGAKEESGTTLPKPSPGQEFVIDGRGQKIAVENLVSVVTKAVMDSLTGSYLAKTTMSATRLLLPEARTRLVVSWEWTQPRTKLALDLWPLAERIMGTPPSEAPTPHKTTTIWF